MSILSVPLKTILMYHADLSGETVPLDYAICDGRTLTSGQQDINPGGSYVTPDLRNRFILGADLTKTAGTAGDAVGGGNINVAAGAPGPKGAGGENQHTTTTPETPAHSHPGGTGSLSYASNSLGSGTDSYAQGATPNVPSLNPFGAGAPTSGSTGGGQPHENRPRYYGVVLIMKVKN